MPKIHRPEFEGKHHCKRCAEEARIEAEAFFGFNRLGDNMNSHIKRWIDELVLSLDIGEEFFALSIKEQLIEKRGTTFVCDNKLLEGWYLNRQCNIC